ncbi:MAG: gliding motility-associated C-terminal domain-containing protein [Ferruginibacter sp.]|nr:gliding motility-associated C-terminal domain-containing protein [Ferruginibacter sp.]
MPKTGPQDCRLNTSGLLDRGIHITSDNPIVAYAHIYNSSVSGACVLLPTNTLGKEYYSINYTNNSNTADANCWFYVVATEPGTTDVEITPSAPAIGHPANVPFTVSLQQGQIYNVMGEVSGNFGQDLTGSVVRSLAGGGSCKRIGVFSGSGRIYINCGSGNTSSDNYMVQAFPKAAWGKKYLTAPTAGSMGRNIYRVCVSDKLAVVKINGVVTSLPLINNFYYEIPITGAPQLIESDLPITVAQYITTQGTCGNGSPGDPEVIYLSPVEQNIKDVLFNSNLLVNNSPPAHQHWVHAIIPNGGTALSSFRIDGAVPAQPFIVHPQDPNYSYIQIPLTLGQHRMTSDSGFNAIAYGYAATESYGYNAGTNVFDLSQQLEVESQYGIETTPSVCVDAQFKFKVYFPDSTLSVTPTQAVRFDSIKWNVSNPAVFVPNNFPVVIPGTVGTPPTVAIDSVNIRNGRQVAWYSLPGTYSVNTAGVYNVTITTYRTTTEGCGGNQQDYTFQLTVTDPPTPGFTYTPGMCVAEPYQFTETTPQVPKPTYKWYWNFGDPGSGANNIATTRNPTHIFSGPGTYTVKYVGITTPGCETDTATQQIVVDPLPSAIIDGTNTVCINGAQQPVTFTGSGASASGLYTFYYHTTPGVPLAVNSGSPTAATAVIMHNPTAAGTFTYTLDSVRVLGSALCVKQITGQEITITVTPDATLNLTSAAGTNNQTVCINTPITNITYAVGGSGTGGTVTGLPAGVTGTYAGGVITITGTPTVSGTFAYTVNTTGPCVKPTANGTITVNADATLNLTSAAGTDNQTICINTVLTNITYAVGGGGTGGTVTGLPAGVTGTYAGGIISITGIPTVAGTFTYTVNTAGPCVLPSATGTITVTPDATLNLTSAAGTNNQTLCINTPITNITYAVGGSGTGGTVTGLPAGVTGTYAGGVITITGTPSASGTFNYTVTTTGPCVKPTASGTITVTPDATLNLTSAAGTDNQTLCINTLLTNITYSVGGSGNGGTVSGLPAGVTGIYAGGTVIISGAPTVAGTFNYSVVTTGPCVNRTLTGTITVTPDATLNLTSAAGTPTQTVCINNPITNITYGIAGSGTGASITAGALPAGVTGTFAAGVFTITGTPTVSGVFNFTVGTAGPCVNPTLSGTITVNANSTIALSSAAGTDNQTKCINTPLTNITYAIAGGGTGASITAGALPAGVTGTYVGGSFVITGTPTVAGTFNYTVTTAGPCINNSLSGTITVTPDATLNLTSAAGTPTQTVCINNPITNITYAIAGSGTGASITAGALPAGVTGTFAAGVFTISGTPTVSGIFNFTVGTAGPCVNPTLSGTITVNANSTIALSSAAGTDNQTKCINTALTPITYAIGGGGTGATITAGSLPAGITATYAAGVFTISGTPTVAGTFNYTVTTGGPCINNSLSGTITVTPNATLNLTSAAGTPTQTVCINNPITNITYAIAGSGTGASITAGALPAGVTGTFAAGVFTISGTPTVSGVFNFTVGTAGPCVNPTLSGTITVNANSTIALSSAAGTDNQSLCNGNAILPITYTIGGGGTGASITAGALPAGVTGTFAAGVFTISGTPTVSGTFNYTVTTTGPCINNALSGTITINPVPSATMAGTTEVCQNDPVWPGITFTGSGGTRPYTFTYSINGGAPQVATTTALSNSVTVQQNTAVANTFTYKLISVQDGSATACSQNMNIPDQVIKVNPLPTGSITGNKLVCINSTNRPDITFSGSGGTTPYMFTYTVNGGAPQTISTTGANTSVTLQHNPTAAGTFTYRLLSVRDGSATACVQNMNVADVVIDVSDVFPAPDFSFTNSVCLPNAIVQFQNLSGIANGTPLTYSWNFGDGSPLSSALNPTHQYYFATPFNVSLTATSNAGCVTTKTIPMNNIHPQPKADFSFSNPNGVCIGDAVTLTDLSDGKDGIITQWHWDLGDGSGIYTTNPINYTYTTAKTYTITFYSVNSIGCNSDTITKSFTVHPYPVVDAGPDRYILEGGQITLQPVVTGNDLQYVWTPNQYLIDNKVANVKVNKPLTDMTYTLTVTARGGCAASDKMFVKLLKFPKIPNTFTPNNDGINDVWSIDYLNTYPDNRVQVFNRAGQLVFESRGYNTPWDGTIKGKPLPFDTYYYIIEPGNGRDPLTGYVTIVK